MVASSKQKQGVSLEPRGKKGKDKFQDAMLSSEVKFNSAKNPFVP